MLCCRCGDTLISLRLLTGTGHLKILRLKVLSLSPCKPSETRRMHVSFSRSNWRWASMKFYSTLSMLFASVLVVLSIHWCGSQYLYCMLSAVRGTTSRPCSGTGASAVVCRSASLAGFGQLCSVKWSMPNTKWPLVAAQS